MIALGAALTVLFGVSLALLVVRWTLASVDPREAIPDPQRVPFIGGHPPPVHAWSRYHARYYAMALLFLAFDMEMVFMYPWAVVFRSEGLVAMIEMAMFIAILLLGVLYAWRERAFEWR